MTKSLCSNCRNQMTGWDGGFFGEPMTCECRIHGVTKGRKSCSNFKKRVTKSDLLNKIQSLEKENEKLQKENNDYEKQFRIINEKLDEYIKTADTYRIPISSLKPGDELGYFNGVYQYMKKLKKDIGGIGYDL